MVVVGNCRKCRNADADVRRTELRYWDTGCWIHKMHRCTLRLGNHDPLQRQHTDQTSQPWQIRLTCTVSPSDILLTGERSFERSLQSRLPLPLPLPFGVPRQFQPPAVCWEAVAWRGAIRVTCHPVETTIATTFDDFATTCERQQQETCTA